MSYSILLRFKSLGSPNAIEEHRNIIATSGYTWAGWWAKPEEILPIEGMHLIDDVLNSSKKITLYMADTNKHCIYPCTVTEVKYSHDFETKIPSPQPDHTPQYYADNTLYIWFRITDIGDSMSKTNCLSNLSFVDYNLFATERGIDYSGFDKSTVESTFLIFIQKRTLMLLRNKDGSDRRGIHLMSNKRNFSTEYALTNSNSILVVSDLHFSEKPECFSFSDCMVGKSYSLQSLSSAINKVTKGESFASLICAGDVTHKSSSEGLRKAEISLFSIFNNHNIDKDNVVIVPGNHDMQFSNCEDEDIIRYTLDDAKANYVKFYNRIIGVKPNEFCAIGRKILLKNRLPVEIVGLNSCCLQQDKHFAGMGLVGQDQLDMVEKEMGWVQPRGERYMSHAFRILVLHHHLYPVEWTQEPKRNCAYSTCLDSVAIMHFAAKNKINLIIHGHKHQYDFVQMCRWTEKKPYCHNILGMGSTSSSDLAQSKSNCIGVLDFNEPNKVKIKILEIQNSNIEETKLLESWDISC